MKRCRKCAGRLVRVSFQVVTSALAPAGQASGAICVACKTLFEPRGHRLVAVAVAEAA